MPHDHREPIDPAVRELIRRKARQLVGRAGLTDQDREDLEQDLLLCLWHRLPDFDSARASLPAFIATVIRSCAANLLRRRRTQRRDYRRARPLHGSDAQEMPAGAGRPDEGLASPRADVADVLAALPPDERALAEPLMHQTIAAVARELGVPRTTLYGARRRLRGRFERAGLRDYL